jgi:hypothetical protein
LISGRVGFVPAHVRNTLPTGPDNLKILFHALHGKVLLQPLATFVTTRKKLYLMVPMNLKMLLQRSGGRWGSIEFLPNIKSDTHGIMLHHAARNFPTIAEAFRMIDLACVQSESELL